MFAFALSLTHSVSDCTHRDVYLPSLCHSLAIALVIMFVLTHLPPFLPHPLNHSFCCTYTHQHAVTSSPSHQLTRFVTHVWLTFALLFTHNSVCDCTHRHACPHPLTDSLTLRYLWLHLLSCMLALILSRTHSTCDYTHHHTCVHHQEWETGDGRERVFGVRG